MANETSGWVKGAAWVLGIVAPLFVTGMVAYNATAISSVHRELDNLVSRHSQNFEGVVDRVVVLEGLTSGLIQSISKAQQHAELHTTEKNYHIGRIDRLTEAVQALSKDSSARPDAYTGTMAREDHALARKEREEITQDLHALESRVRSLELNQAKASSSRQKTN